MNIAHHMPDAVRHATDAVSFGLVVGTLADALPAVAALLSIIWTVIRIAETRTVQNFFRRRRGEPET